LENAVDGVLRANLGRRLAHGFCGGFCGLSGASGHRASGCKFHNTVIAYIIRDMDQSSLVPVDIAPSAAAAAAAAFSRPHAGRRAIRRSAPRPVADETLRALVSEAQLAPSSRNGQPYRFITIRSAALKAEVAGVCRDQEAARTAPALVAVIAGPALALEAIE